MHFFSILATLVAAAAAAPTVLHPRAACGIGSSSVTVGSKSQTMTGPFYLTVSDADKLEGNYAVSGVGNNIVFGRKFAYSASKYYITKSGALAQVNNGVMQTASQVTIGGFGHVDMGGNGVALKCKLDSSCNVNCSAGGSTLSCLSSPNYQPNWRLSTHKSLSGCIAFQPKAKVIAFGGSTTTTTTTTTTS